MLSSLRRGKGVGVIAEVYLLVVFEVKSQNIEFGLFDSFRRFGYERRRQEHECTLRDSVGERPIPEPDSRPTGVVQ